MPLNSFVVFFRLVWKLKTLVSDEDCDLTKTIPLVLHGDDAESHRRRSFCVVTMGSLAVGGISMWDSKFLLYVTDNSRCTDDTFATLDLWIAWSLTELQLGAYMDINPYGMEHQPFRGKRNGLIADGYRGVVCFFKGDEKYIQKCFKTSHSAVSKNCCFVCKASTEAGPLLYTNHGLDAAHRATRMTTTEFITGVVGVRTFISIPGFHVNMVVYDWLHAVDLCIIPEASASALLELTHGQGLFGAASTQDERLRQAYVAFSRACKRARIRNRGQIFSVFLDRDMIFFLRHPACNTIWVVALLTVYFCVWCHSLCWAGHNWGNSFSLPDQNPIQLWHRNISMVRKLCHVIWAWWAVFLLKQLWLNGSVRKVLLRKRWCLPSGLNLSRYMLQNKTLTMYMRSCLCTLLLG